MKRVLWVILGIVFAPSLYAGNKQQEKAQRVQPTLTTTPNAQKIKGRGLGIAAHKEVAPTVTPNDEKGLGQIRSQPGTLNKEVPPPMTPGVSDPTPKAGRALTFGRDSLKGTTKEVAPTVTPGAVDKTTVNTSKSNTFKDAAPTVTPTKVSAKLKEKV